MSIDDGHFPRIKPYSEYERDDLDRLVKQAKWLEVGNVIREIKPDSHTGTADFITYLASVVHDRQPELTVQLYNQLETIGIAPTSLTMNYFLQSAAHFRLYGHLMQLLYQATITDIPVDLNTYLKLLSQVYFDYEEVAAFDRKDFITYLYTLFANDHTMEDF